MGWIQRFGNKILQKPEKIDKKTQEKTKPDGATKKTTKNNTDKELATKQGEPYVAIIGLDVNPENLHEGAFELDWNDKFIANLVRAGYQMQANEPENVIVDRWFQNICRHVVMESWEQEQAINPQPRFTQTRDIGGGRKEVS